MFETFQEYSLALELLRRRARISIIHRETGISKEVLRTAYKKLYGCSPSSGALKYSTRGLTRTNRSYKETTLFAFCYHKVDKLSQASSIQKIIQAFDIYSQTDSSRQLNFSAAWVIAKDIASKSVELSLCKNCGSPVLLNARESNIDKCGICKAKVTA